MKRRAIRILLVALIMVLPLWGADLGSGTGAHGWRRPAYAPGELLVKYKSAVRTEAADYFRQRWGVSIVHTFRDIGVHHVKLPADMTVEEAVDLYRHDPDVEYAEPNYYRYITATSNDTDYQSFLWGMNNTGQTICPPEGNVCSPDPCVTGTAGASIHAPSAWDVSTDCTSVTVAIIDTGVDYNHPDLAGNIWSNPGEVAGDGIDNDANGYIDDVRGWDFVDNDNAPMDANGHGTHVAGTIGAVGNNSRGVTGVCWTAKLLPLRAFDAFGDATTATIIDAMEYAGNYAVTNNAKVVINASYGGPDPSDFEYAEISNLNTAGVLLVAAAGNGSPGTNNDSTRTYPASYDLPNIIAVAATDQNDNLACFSNYGPTSVHVAAPGTNIYSAMPGRQPVFTDNFDAGIGNWTVDLPWGAFAPGYDGTGQSLSVNLVSNQVGSFSAAPTNAIDLSSKTGALLTFKLNWSIASGDALYLETSPDAINWTSLGSISDTSSGQWVDFIADLGALDGTATAHFRFRLQRNNSGQADAVYIDDVEVTASAVQDTYQFLDGTSMATPHVTGLAALVWSDIPTLTHLQVKARIINCVDRLGSLSGSVFTQGRINAANSLNNTPAPPVGLSASAVSPSQINLTWANAYLDPIGFNIERKDGAAGAFAEIADLPSNTASYSDTGLTKSTTYTYRVKAYTSDNDSEWSAEVTATTPEPSSKSAHGAAACFIDTALEK